MSSNYHNGSLPPLAHMSANSSQSEQPDYQARRPQLPSLTISNHSRPSPQSPYPGLSQNHNSRISTTVPSVAFLTSGTDSRRPYSDEKEPNASRMSLPSISEALASGSTQGVPSSAMSSHQSYNHSSPRTSQSTWKRSAADISQYSHDRHPLQDNQPVRAPYMGSIAPATPQSHAAHLPRSHSPKAEPIEYPFRVSALNPYSTARRTSPPPSSSHTWSALPSETYEHGRPAELSNMPYVQREYPSEAYHTQASAPHHASSDQPYPPVSQYPAASSSESDYRTDIADAYRADAPKKARIYGEHVKMHFDVYDLESIWEDIASCGHQVFQIAQYHQQRAHQIPKSSPLAGPSASIGELDAIIRNANIMSESALRMRDMAVSHEAALAEHSQQLSQGVKHALADESQDGSRDIGYGGADPNKKRRGRAAPPGRCHSCNRAETPEWRRGPDGARTLCNACGLHYAKLTRKAGANKQPLTGSNLRPTSLESTSPNK